MKFVDREPELEVLSEFWRSDEPGMLVIFGRRRVGKTRLLLEFLRRVKGRTVYLLASRRPIRYNLARFSRKLSETFGLPGLRFRDFAEMFEFLAKTGEKVLVVIDEFGYLVEQDPGVLSDFQEIADLILPRSGIKLIISGSIITLMESHVLGVKSPLYGRFTRRIKLLPLRFRDVFSWFPGISPRDAVVLYSVTGGVPKYLEFFSGKNVLSEIERNFFRGDSFLFSDAEYLLKEELREPTIYFQILEAIAMGYVTITEIANYAFTKPTSVTPYLRTLQNMGIIRRILPFGKRKGRGIYEFSDYYMMFWFRFVNPYREEIESGLIEEAVSNFRRGFNSFLGLAFEMLSRDLLREYFAKRMSISRAGKWWRRDADVDLIIADDRAKRAVLCEVRWSDLTEREAIREASKLEELGERIEAIRGYEKVYCVFAREIRDGGGLGNYVFLSLEDVLQSLEATRRTRRG